MVIEDPSGRRLGTLDIEYSRWEQVGTHFENVSALVIPIEQGGEATELYIQNGNEILRSEGVNMPRHVTAGASIVFPAWNFRMLFREQHDAVAEKLLNDAPLMSLSEEMIRDLRRCADHLRVSLGAGGATLRDAAREMLVAVDGLLKVVHD